VMIFYEKSLMLRLASVMRQVAPDILLVQSPNDYMEDHMITCRLAVTAAFCRGITYFPVDPPCEGVLNSMTVYHAQPAGNLDYLGRSVEPDFYVDISDVLDDKRNLLSEHKSQQEWLDKSQGMGAYVDEMVRRAVQLGALSGRFRHAEGWRRHHPAGFCTPDTDPIADALSGLVLKANQQ